MTLPVIAILIAAAAYLSGSLPFGYLTARFVAGIDIRSQGSGNIGATNIGRILGARYGLLVLVLDCLKGLLPVVLTPLLVPESADESAAHLQVLSGVMTVVGHMFPVWLGFRGGKGVATALGVTLGIGTWAVLVAFAVFIVVLAIFRIMSLSSMSGAVTFAGVQMAMLKPHPFTSENWSVAVFSLMVPALIIWRHRSNIGRMMRGEEERFRFARRKPAENSNSPPEERDNEGSAPLSGGFDARSSQAVADSADG